MFFPILSVAGSMPPVPGVLTPLHSVWIPHFSLDNQIYCPIFVETSLFFLLCSFGISYVSGAVHGMMCVVDVSIPMAFLH